MSNNESVFGLHAVQALLKSAPQRVQVLNVAQDRRDLRLEKLVQAAERENIPVKRLARHQLDRLETGNHQGIIALCAPGKQYDEAYLWQLIHPVAAEPDKSSHPFLLILDGVTDPHNLGACLRSAEAAGVDAVIIPKDKSAGVTATVRKVACGAAEVLPVIPVTNLSRVLKRLQDEGVWLTGTAGDARQTLYDVDLTGPLALVMGAEGKGLRRLTREHCDILVNIPMAGQVSSLNVSVATGVCLFEAVRQRAVSTPEP